MVPIGSAASASGVSIETIRYYERTGVLPAPPRSASGRRLYDEKSIARLRFIRRCRELGFPLSEARTMLALSAAQDPCADMRMIAGRQLEAVRAKIAELKTLEGTLERMVRSCDAATPGADCPAVETLSSPRSS